MRIIPLRASSMSTAKAPRSRSLSKEPLLAAVGRAKSSAQAPSHPSQVYAPTPSAPHTRPMLFPDEFAVPIVPVKTLGEGEVQPPIDEKVARRKEKRAFVKVSIIHLLGVLFLSMAAVVVWSKGWLIHTDFPWFIPVMGFSALTWCLYFWLYSSTLTKKDKKKRRYMFSMHLTIAFVVVLSSSLLYLSYPPCDTHHWLTFPVSFFGVTLSLHFSKLFVPSTYNWLVAQLLVYVFVVGAVFALWFADRHAFPYWEWVATIGAIVIGVQMAAFFIVRFLTYRRKMALRASEARRLLDEKKARNSLKAPMYPPFVTPLKSEMETGGGAYSSKSNSPSLSLHNSVEDYVAVTSSSNDDLPPYNTHHSNSNYNRGNFANANLFNNASFPNYSNFALPRRPSKNIKNGSMVVPMKNVVSNVIPEDALLDETSSRIVPPTVSVDIPPKKSPHDRKLAPIDQRRGPNNGDRSPVRESQQNSVSSNTASAIQLGPIPNNISINSVPASQAQSLTSSTSGIKVSYNFTPGSHMMNSPSVYDVVVLGEGSSNDFYLS